MWKVIIYKTNFIRIDDEAKDDIHAWYYCNRNRDVTAWTKKNSCNTKQQ